MSENPVDIERRAAHRSLEGEEMMYGTPYIEAHLLIDLKYDFREIILELRSLVKEMREK